MARAYVVVSWMISPYCIEILIHILILERRKAYKNWFLLEGTYKEKETKIMEGWVLLLKLLLLSMYMASVNSVFPKFLFVVEPLHITYYRPQSAVVN